MRKKKILIHTNHPSWLTGLGKNGRYLAEYLYKTGKYDIAYYCSNVVDNDPSLNTLPWRAYGAIPSNPAVHQQWANDPGKQRDVAYGSYNIDAVIEKEKPDIYWGSDDLWSWSGYIDKPWWNKINSVLHATIDSRPILGVAFEQAKKTKNYTVWSKFAEKEMKKYGPEFNHVRAIYGGFSAEHFKPISKTEKLEYRRRFGINPNTTIFNMVNRNQLRKGFNHALAAFAELKKDNPKTDAKLHFHTSFSEKGAGFDIPQTTKFYGVNPDDVLCTYVCKQCKGWHVAPYTGEDTDCPACKAQKTCITPTIHHGVHDEEMKYLHGIGDAGLSIMTSGGLEFMTVTSMLCGLYTACTNYSCGEDFCEQPFVYSLPWAPYYEPGNNFIKAATSVPSIKAFMAKVCLMDSNSRSKVGKQSREWAVNTFSIEVVGKQWDEYFDTMPLIDWTNIKLSYQPKNENYPMPPDSMSDIDFITALYDNILFQQEPLHGDGHQNWQTKLKSGALKRKQVYDFFMHIAKQENAKNSAPQDFNALLEKTGKKRALFLIKESIGDIMMCTALFESFHKEYPETDFYVMTDSKYHEILAGNEHVYKTLPYIPQFEQEMTAIGAGLKEGTHYFDHYFAPAIGTQVRLGYLGRNKPAFNSCLALT